MRFLPLVKVSCRICGTSYEIHNHYERDKGVVSSPAGCPACAAPPKHCPPRAHVIGQAKGLWLTLEGAAWTRRQYGDAVAFVVNGCLDEADVDRLESAALSLDLAAWEQADRSRRAGRNPNNEERQEIKALRVLRARPPEQRAAMLREATAAAKERLRAERARHMAIFEERRPGNAR